MRGEKVFIKSKDKQKILDLRKDSILLPSYTASQARKMDVKSFFEQEKALVHLPCRTSENFENPATNLK